MAGIRDNPWYRQIFQEGFEEGYQKGLEESRQLNLQLAKQEQEITVIIRQLTHRFGLSPELQQRIRNLSLEQLEELTEELLDFAAIADLHKWLHNQDIKLEMQKNAEREAINDRFNDTMLGVFRSLLKEFQGYVQHFEAAGLNHEDAENSVRAYFTGKHDALKQIFAPYGSEVATKVAEVWKRLSD